MYDWIVILCIICGVYMIYAAVLMKYKGKFLNSVIFSSGINENSIRDKEGFIKYLYGRLMLCGSVDVIMGIICLISDFVNGQGVMSLIANFVFFISIAAYGIFINKALRKYVNR